MNGIAALEAVKENITVSIFTIDDDNNITAYGSTEEQANHGDAEGLIQFHSRAALAKVSADWPLSRFVEIWNSIPGQLPVKKFRDRKSAVTRLWSAIQPLAGTGQADSAAQKVEARPQAAKPAKRHYQPVRAKQAHNKKAQVIRLMKRGKGATLAEIMQATQWQKHTVRGFVSLLGSKGGLTIDWSKSTAGDRTYKLAK